MEIIMVMVMGIHMDMVAVEIQGMGMEMVTEMEMVEIKVDIQKELAQLKLPTTTTTHTTTIIEPNSPKTITINLLQNSLNANPPLLLGKSHPTPTTTTMEVITSLVSLLHQLPTNPPLLIKSPVAISLPINPPTSPNSKYLLLLNPELTHLSSIIQMLSWI